jgi:hypothetical protein
MDRGKDNNEKNYLIFIAFLSSLRFNTKIIKIND